VLNRVPTVLVISISITVASISTVGTISISRLINNQRKLTKKCWVQKILTLSVLCK
jgi:hypothetical protein